MADISKFSFGGNEYNFKDEVARNNGGGHTILSSSGATMPKRSNLKFANCTVTDDAQGDMTIVTPNGGTAIKLADVSGANVSMSGRTASITWTDPENVVVSGVALAEWAGTKVVRKAGSAPTGEDDGVVVVDSKTKNAYSSTALVDSSGLEYDTVYYYRFFPYTVTGLATDGSSATGTPERIAVAVPTVGAQLTYNGGEQTQSFNGYDPTKMTVSGNTGDDAGDYTATFTPLEDYKWSDNTRGEKTVGWNIEKANQTITLSKDSVTLNADKLSDTVTASAQGTLYVQSNNTSVASASIAGGTITIASVGDTTGNTTVTVTAAATANYKQATKNITVVCSFALDLETATWAEVSNASKNGSASSWWKVGDRKSVLINGTVGTLSINTTLYVFILGFDHNSSVEGKGITFGGFKNADGTDVCLVSSNYNSTSNNGTKCFNLNHWGGSSSPYNTNYGGWKGCDARYDILGSTNTQPSGYGSTPTTSRVGYDAGTTTATSPVANTLMAALPSSLRAAMKPITKYTDNKGNSSNVAANVTSSVDYLPLLSEFEVQGARTYANESEKNSQKQYTYYANGNSKIKYRHDSPSSTASWWCRSAGASGAYYFCYVYTDGSAYGHASRNSIGLAPAFLV